MIELRRVVTRKGQVTVPAEIRRELGLRVGDEVAFLVDSGEVRLARSGSVVARTAGVFKSRKRALSAEDLRDAAEKAIAEEAVERAGV
ncbi:MAG: AbrB/MazE/SpoVT family DNA-binding domain-containing protein [Dehalococcoidia bacterium]